jgi:hypothetical protein
MKETIEEKDLRLWTRIVALDFWITLKFDKIYWN